MAALLRSPTEHRGHEASRPPLLGPDDLGIGGLLPKNRAGTLRAEFVRCGKRACRCARGDLHGPYPYLRFRDGAGHQRKRYVRPELVPAVAQEIARRRAARLWCWRRLLAEISALERAASA